MYLLLLLLINLLELINDLERLLLLFSKRLIKDSQNVLKRLIKGFQNVLKRLIKDFPNVLKRLIKSFQNVLKRLIKGFQSSLIDVVSGEDTVLDPLLFLLHINDLPSVICYKVRLFADDCLIYRYIKN